MLFRSDYVAAGLYISDVKLVGEREMDVLCDPQTSGGLLIAVPAEKEASLMQAMVKGNVDAAVIGRVVQGEAGRITVLP